MTTYATYGFRGDSLDVWMGRLSAALELEFEGRYSDHWRGGYWNHERGNGQGVTIVANVEDEDGELFEVGRDDLTVVVDGAGWTADELAALDRLGVSD